MYMDTMISKLSKHRVGLLFEQHVHVFPLVFTCVYVLIYHTGHAATIITVFLLSVIVYSRCLAPALGGSCTSITGRHVYDCVARECLKCGTPVENSTTVVGGGRRIGGRFVAVLPKIRILS